MGRARQKSPRRPVRHSTGKPPRASARGGLLVDLSIIGPLRAAPIRSRKKQREWPWEFVAWPPQRRCPKVPLLPPASVPQVRAAGTSVSEGTVRNHISSILAKLHLYDRRRSLSPAGGPRRAPDGRPARRLLPGELAGEEGWGQAAALDFRAAFG